MNDEQQQFIEDFGQYLARWGLPRTTGRVYGYLLLKGQPASSDEIAEKLQAAKSGVSVTVRQLLTMGLARSSGSRGSRRLLYEAVYDLDAIVAARTAHMVELVARLRQGARAARGGPSVERLTSMADDIEDWVETVPGLMQRSRARQKA